MLNKTKIYNSLPNSFIQNFINFFSTRYVKVYLLPDKNKTSKKKTMHRRKTINPIWNETIKVSPITLSFPSFGYS